MKAYVCKANMFQHGSTDNSIYWVHKQNRVSLAEPSPKVDNDIDNISYIKAQNLPESFANLY